jgi:hypothetical protein
MTRVRRGFLWLYLLAASLVAAGVFVQAFSIAAYVRGAGSDALDLHSTVGFIVHSIEIVVFLVALVAFWGEWRIVGFAALLPIVGTFQVLLIGDTDKQGGLGQRPPRDVRACGAPDRPRPFLDRHALAPAPTCGVSNQAQRGGTDWRDCG